jgi:hypothetical protein
VDPPFILKLETSGLAARPPSHKENTSIFQNIRMVFPFLSIFPSCLGVFVAEFLKAMFPSCLGVFVAEAREEDLSGRLGGAFFPQPITITSRETKNKTHMILLTLMIAALPVPCSAPF